MKTITLGKHRVTVYDSIDELPIKRFHAYNKMLLIDAGIGGTLAEFDAHIQKAMSYARSKTPEMAVVELDNLRQCVYMIMQGVSPRHLAFACLVSEIDGKKCDDIAEDSLKQVAEILADASVTELATSLEEVKKKIDTELQLYFPKVFDDASIKEYYDQLKQRTLAILDGLINGENEERNRQIDIMTDELMRYSKPQVFSGADNVEISHDKSFAKMLVILAEQLHIDASNYSVMQFYNAFEYLQESIRAKKKAMKAK